MSKPALTEDIAFKALGEFFQDKPFVFFGSGMSCAIDSGFGMPALRDALLSGIPNASLSGQDLKEWTAVRNNKEYEVKVKTPGSPSWVDLPDVGFGISQVLPVLVQCFYAPPGSILFIEQPELHLHPKAQSHLADLFIDVLSSRVDGRQRNIQLVIETHSEHFLQRLQRRIAEAQPERLITPQQVAAYFAHTAGAESKLEPLQIDLPTAFTLPQPTGIPKCPRSSLAWTLTGLTLLLP